MFVSKIAQTKAFIEDFKKVIIGCKINFCSTQFKMAAIFSFSLENTHKKLPLCNFFRY